MTLRLSGTYITSDSTCVLYYNTPYYTHTTLWLICDKIRHLWYFPTQVMFMLVQYEAENANILSGTSFTDVLICGIFLSTKRIFLAAVKTARLIVFILLYFKDVCKRYPLACQTL